MKNPSLSRVALAALCTSALFACGDDSTTDDDLDAGELRDAAPRDATTPADAFEPVDASEPTDASEPVDAFDPVGMACTSSDDCGRGPCVDGVCCDSVCDGTCEACAASLTGGTDGTCAPVTAGTDPGDECAEDSCGTGFCGDGGTCGTEPSGTMCRAAAGDCDSAEVCDGVGTACPADSLLGPGNVCRAAVGLCDLAEECDGTDVDCPTDRVAETGTTCRGALGACDAVELCDGLSTACPANVVRGSGEVCRASAGPCDLLETCNGSSISCPSDALLPSSSSVCAPYRCTGASAMCTTTCAANSDCTVGDLCLSGDCMAARRVFVTSTTMTGDLGGLAGADAICQARANVAGLRGTYRAWLSSSTVDAGDRLSAHTGPYYRLDGTVTRVVANDWTDLTDGLGVAIATDEFGNVQGNQRTWTGTDYVGDAVSPNCLNWTSSSGSETAVVGNSSAGGMQWSQWSSPLLCSSSFRLFCLEQ